MNVTNDSRARQTNENKEKMEKETAHEDGLIEISVGGSVATAGPRE